MLTSEQIVECNRKYWNDIIEMGRKHNIDPWKLVKLYDEYDIEQVLHYHPDFAPDTYDVHTVKFAEFILEGTPIFADDWIYHKNGEKVQVVCARYSNPMVINITRFREEYQFQDSCFLHQLTLKDPIINLPLNHTEIDDLLTILDGFQTLKYLGYQNAAKILSDRLLKIKEENSK